MNGKSDKARSSVDGLRRRRRGAGVLGAILVAGALTAVAPDSWTTDPDAPATARRVDVIVSGRSAQAAAREVRSVGGTVTGRVNLINGVTARVLAGTRLPSDVSSIPDRPVTFASEGTGVTAGSQLVTSTVRGTVGLPSTGNEGAGVTVALVDTGVADVADLAGRLDHIDVTGTGPGDGYGHGTFLAGAIAGSGLASDGRFQGVAPGARILDVKVADASGVTSLGLVLRGLQAVSDTADRYGTRVVNLSLASDSPMPYQVDPLNQALRTLWHRGLTVVVAAGNDGPGAGSVESPGNDPTLLTVGSLDEASTSSRTDDTVAGFSGRGPTDQGIDKPELVAPGAHLVGLRSAGSYVDSTYPGARVEDDYVRGSGTSVSTAVTSAAVADLLAASPGLRPDQVEYLLTTTAYRAPGLANGLGAGAGGLDLRAALALAQTSHLPATPTRADEVPGDPQRWAALADAFARGDRQGATEAWRTLSPEARSWAARSWASLDPTARSWAEQSWAARSWADASVSSEAWAARSWAARSWAARSWAGQEWAARSWAGDDWVARSWANGAWSARSWAAGWR